MSSLRGLFGTAVGRSVAAVTLAVALGAGAWSDAGVDVDPSAQGPGGGRGGGGTMASRGMASRRMASGGDQDGAFADAATCALCHSAAPNAVAMKTAAGEDVSPHGLWRGTMMANSFRDPYWQAQVAKEISLHEAAGQDIEALCLRCHGPTAHHNALLADAASPGVFASAGRAVAEEGVTCTVCHQIEPTGLGSPSTWSGQAVIAGKGWIYGPYPDPFWRPMLMHSGYRATQGEHVRDSGLCATCHTLHTRHDPEAEPFPEQTPYLEWLNSEFSDQGETGRTGTSRTCQECHMPDQGALRVARNPGGRDFPPVRPREPYRAHAFVGGNAFMLDVLRENREVLGVTAPASSLERTAAATRRQLAHDTATLAIEAGAVRDGSLQFAVRVTNETGHKLPTGYPARRAWLRVQVRHGEQLLFESGAYDEGGRIVGLTAPQGEPHHALIERPEQVQIYEMVAADAAGQPTTSLVSMAERRKDNRLLPRGYREDGPHVADTAPCGVDDADFVAGGDVVAFRLPVGESVGGGFEVTVELLYQAVPPAWVDALRPIEHPAAARFVGLYDAADKTPERLGAARVEIE